MLSLEGSIVRVIYRSPKTSYSVLEVRLERIDGAEKGSRLFKKRKAVVVGPCPAVEKGSFVRAKGSWVESAKHGLQLKASLISQVAPSSGDACKRYLRNFRGVGAKRAQDIVSAFPDENVFEILERQPERLLEVPGIGRSGMQRLVSEWKNRKGLYQATDFLHSVGIGPAIAEKLAVCLGGTTEACAQAVRSDPYQVVDRSQALLSFGHADDIALRFLHVSPTDNRRLREGVVHMASRLAWMGGHTRLPRDRIVHAAIGLLQVKESEMSLVEMALQQETTFRLPSLNDGEVSPLALYRAEASVAASLERIARAPHPLPFVDPESFVRKAERRFGESSASGDRRLAQMQAEAVRQAMQQKVVVVTGGPGVGKTTAISSIVGSFRQMGLTTVVASPTGRASAKLAAVTRQKASTLHRLLEYDPEVGGFRRNSANKLNGHLFLVDEASMIDAELAAAFLEAVPERAVLVLVGDVDQLPAVGPGNVLQDIVSSGTVTTVRLDRNYRQQDQTSHIVRAAHAMLRNERLPVMPFSVGSGLETFQEFTGESDLRFIKAESPAKILSSVVRVMDELRDRFQVDPVEDVQVLTAMRKGPIGSRAFNGVLQNHFNQSADRSEVVHDANGMYSFRVGDKVMQIVNDYSRDVYNGEIGRVCQVDPAVNALRIKFPGSPQSIEYFADDLKDIEPAFACTIHKSQGCEFPCAIVPVHPDYNRVLQRNLLYTGITRGAKLTILVGDMAAVDEAVAKTDANHRMTFLKERLAKSRD